MVVKKDMAGDSMLYMEKEGLHLQDSLAKKGSNESKQKIKATERNEIINKDAFVDF